MARIKIVNVDDKTVVVHAFTKDDAKHELHNFEIVPNTFTEVFVNSDMFIEVREKE
jgi:hypothetical protein